MYTYADSCIWVTHLMWTLESGFAIDRAVAIPLIYRVPDDNTKIMPKTHANALHRLAPYYLCHD